MKSKSNVKNKSKGGNKNMSKKARARARLKSIVFVCLSVASNPTHERNSPLPFSQVLLLLWAWLFEGELALTQS